MIDSLENFYQNRVYPPMSHPPADPAVTSVAARIAGMRTAAPPNAAILEIGCGTGHHLLSQASRWPESRCTGVDVSHEAIRRANELAAEAEIGNATFHAASLLDFEPIDGPYDFITAHGFFSWVPDEVKAALFGFCERHLSDRGIAVISFNVAAGWAARIPVIRKVRAIQKAGDVDEMTALSVLKTVTIDATELGIIDDMLAKGTGILPFDDFAPVNDPWPLDRFVRSARENGLRWLGESEPAKNRPEPWTKADESALSHLKADAPAYHHAADEMTGRTFRSAMFCRVDTPVEGLAVREVFDFFVRKSQASSAGDEQIIRALDGSGASAISVTELAGMIRGMTLPELAVLVLRGAGEGWLELRSEAVAIPAGIPGKPCLNAWRRVCASRGLPVVDAWLRSCAFPPRHFDLLARMDGSKTAALLAEESRVRCPELDFQRWLAHLAGRGIFS
jgi:SAM-dependent methyltransferase